MAADSRRLVSLPSGDFHGLTGRPVDVQVDVSGRGKQDFRIVGLPGRSTRESRDRICAAIRHSGFRVPTGRVLVNLAPASREKHGGAFDLPIAIGILVASGQLPLSPELGGLSAAGGPSASVGVLGELGLSGEISPVRGALLIADRLRAEGLRRFIVPRDNATEIAWMPRGRSVRSGRARGRGESPATTEQRFVDRRSERGPRGAALVPERRCARFRGRPTGRLVIGRWRRPRRPKRKSRLCRRARSGGEQVGVPRRGGGRPQHSLLRLSGRRKNDARTTARGHPPALDDRRGHRSPSRRERRRRRRRLPLAARSPVSRAAPHRQLRGRRRWGSRASSRRGHAGPPRRPLPRRAPRILPGRPRGAARASRSRRDHDRPQSGDRDVPRRFPAGRRE